MKREYCTLCACTWVSNRKVKSMYLHVFEVCLCVTEHARDVFLQQQCMCTQAADKGEYRCEGCGY